MSDNYFRGDAVPVQEVKTLTVGGTPAAAQVYTATINTHTVAYTAIGADTNITIAVALQLLLSATATAPVEFDEGSWAVPTTAVITVTANTAGVPFTVTSSATGTGTLVTATTVNATGPAWWSEPKNWSLGAIPVNGDNVYLRRSAQDILYGIDQNAVTLALLDIDGSYTGKIGLPDFNPLGYAEYRETFLKIGATTCYVGRGNFTGPGRFRWNAGIVQTALNVYGTGTPDADAPGAVDFVGTHASNALLVQRGTVSVALKPSVASTILTATIGSKDNPTNDATVFFGYTATLGTLNMAGGTINVWNGLTTANIRAGTLTCSLGAYTTINNENGTVNYDTGGTLGTYTGGTSSLLDCSRIARARTITTAVFEPTSSFRDPSKTVTFGGSGAFIRCGLDELKEFNVGEQFYFQRL